MRRAGHSHTCTKNNVLHETSQSTHLIIDEEGLSGNVPRGSSPAATASEGVCAAAGDGARTTAAAAAAAAETAGGGGHIGRGSRVWVDICWHGRRLPGALRVLQDVIHNQFPAGRHRRASWAAKLGRQVGQASGRGQVKKRSARARGGAGHTMQEC